MMKYIAKALIGLTLLLSSCLSSNFCEIVAEKGITRKGIKVSSNENLIIGKHQNNWYLEGKYVCYNLKYTNYFSEIHHLHKVYRTQDVIHHTHPEKFYLKLDQNIVDGLRNLSALSPSERAKLLTSLLSSVDSGQWVDLPRMENIKTIPFNANLRIVNLENKESLYAYLSSPIVFLAVDIPASIGATLFSPFIIWYGFASGAGW